VREWLQDLPKGERKIIGVDIMTVQFRWPLGMLLVDNIGRRHLGKCAASYQRESREHYFSCTRAKLSFCMALSRKREKLQTKTGLWL
jgi:hypothetical protein